MGIKTVSLVYVDSFVCTRYEIVRIFVKKDRRSKYAKKHSL